MKILIVNTSDSHGGAARAAYRLHKALLNQGVDSQMLVQSKNSDDFTVITAQSKLQKRFNNYRPLLDSIFLRFLGGKARTLFSVAWVPSNNLVRQINNLKPDIVHLHWINGGMLRVEDLTKIKAPIVWSLHDMWPFSGGWHYLEDNGTKKQESLSSHILRRKRRSFRKIKKMVIIGLSQWMQKSAINSGTFHEHNVVNLPNPINVELFKPFDKEKSRELWSLPLNKKLVLFGAMGATSDPRKGFKELSHAFSLLNRNDLEFVVFGASEPKNPPNLGCKVHYVGSLSDDTSLVTLYNAVDAMIVPSLQENLSNAIMESLSCSTPVIGFDIGGNSDMINHKKNGYLARAFDTQDLANGIEWVIDNPDYNTLCENARSKVLTEFEESVLAKRYISLYEDTLNE